MPLAEWKNKPSLDSLERDYRLTKQVHDQAMSEIISWLDLKDVTGKERITKQKGRSAVTNKLVRKNNEWRYSSLEDPFLSNDKIFNINPVTWADRKASNQNSILLNYQFKSQIGLTRLINNLVRTLVDEGTAIMRVAWKSTTEVVRMTEPVFEYQPVNDEMFLLKMQEDANKPEYAIDELMRESISKSKEAGMPVRAVISGYKERISEKVVEDRPDVSVCENDDVFIDPTCKGDINNAEFVIYRYRSTLSNLRKEGLYSNLDQVDPEEDSEMKDVDYFEFDDKARRKLTVFEYWGFYDVDGTGKTRAIIVAWVGNIVIRREINPYPDGKIPFVLVQYMPRVGEVYGEPDAALLGDNQRITSGMMRGMLDSMGRSANAQTGTSKAALDVTNRKRFLNGENYEFNPTADPRSFFYEHSYPEIPRSAEYLIDRQERDSESLTGVRSFSGGISGKGLGDVAAGIRGALDSAATRELGILRRVSDAIVSVGRKFISMNGEFMSEEFVVRITDEEFVQMKRDDLYGSVDITIGISTAEVDDKKSQQLGFLLQTLGNNIDVSMTGMILSEIAKLNKMPDLAKKIEEFKPEPDPMQVALQEAELEKLKSEIDLNKSKIEENLANAMKYKSEAEANDLDFVEKGSGVTQERDIQKITSQAESQTKMKIIESNLNNGNKNGNK